MLTLISRGALWIIAAGYMSVFARGRSWQFADSMFEYTMICLFCSSCNCPQKYVFFGLEAFEHQKFE